MIMLHNTQYVLKIITSHYWFHNYFINVLLRRNYQFEQKFCKITSYVYIYMNQNVWFSFTAKNSICLAYKFNILTGGTTDSTSDTETVDVYSRRSSLVSHSEYQQVQIIDPLRFSCQTQTQTTNSLNSICSTESFVGEPKTEG